MADAIRGPRSKSEVARRATERSRPEGPLRPGSRLLQTRRQRSTEPLTQPGTDGYHRLSIDTGLDAGPIEGVHEVLGRQVSAGAGSKR